MIRSLYYEDRNEQVYTDLAAKDLAIALRDKRGLLWVDIAGEEASACGPILRETFGFHPLAVDDALEETHVPKVDDWGQYLYLVLEAVTFDMQADRLLNTVELDVFLGAHYVVTYHTQPIPAVDRVWAACQRDGRSMQRSASYVLYRLADELVTDCMPVIEQIDEAIDQIEDRIFSSPAPDLLERLFALKRALLRLRRTVAPQREALNKLARGDFDVIDKEERVSFRDVYDHLVRLHDIVESLRDLVGSALDTYLSVINNRMSDVMKVLTVITTIFIPLTLIAGIYGMNFKYMPELGWPGGYPMIWLVMLIIAGAMLVYFRKKKWL
jgi:magnesium transporter